MMQKAALVPLVLVSALSMVLASCSSDDDGDSTPDTTEMAPAGETSEMAPGGDVAPMASTVFDGIWASGCELDDEDVPEDGYVIEMLEISGASASLRSLAYSDDTCQTPAPLITEIVVSFSLVYPGGTTTTALGDATHIDVTPESVSVNGQPLSAEQLQALATDGGLETVYDLALIDNSSLFFGDVSGEGVGESADARPTTLDATGLTRQ